MALTKEILLKLGLDAKTAEAVLKKIREEAEKPVKTNLQIDTKSLDEAMQGLNKFFTQLQKGLGKGKGFEALSQSFLKVSKNIDKVITTTKEVSAINVNPIGLDETKKKIEEIVNSLKEMTAVKPDADFFTVVRNSLEGINALVQSICTGMNFDNIHPSPYFLKQIDELTVKMGKLESSKKSLEAIQEQYQKTVINEETGKTVTTRPTNRAALAAREYATSGIILDYKDNKSITGVKESLSYMKDYIRLGGQLKDVGVTANKSLADVFSAMRADSTLNENSNIKQMIDEVAMLQQVSNQLAEARKNLQVAQARENRDIVATFDTTSVESFASAIKSAVSELNHLDIKIPEGTKITGLNEDSLNNLLEKLDAISNKLLEIHGLMQKAFDTSELQAEMKETVGKTPIKIDVEPELTDPAGFVNEVEKQLAGHKVKLGIDLTDAQNESGEAAGKTSLTNLSQTFQEIQQKASAAADAVERITKQTSEGKKTSFDDFQNLSKVLDELKKSLDDINIDKLNSLSDILTKLSGKNKLNERIDSICKSLSNLKDGLNDSSGSAGFIQELNTLASQGEALKDLAAVLKTSKKQIEKAKETINDGNKKKKKQYNTNELYKDLSSSLEGKNYDDLGDFNRVVKVNSNGSAIIEFMEKIGDEAVVTKVKIDDVYESIKKIKSNDFTSDDYTHQGSSYKRAKAPSSKTSDKSSSKKSEKKTYDVEKLRKDLSSALKDNPISDFGNVTSVAIQKNGSAVVKFLKTIEGQAETTEIKIKDVESALLKLSSGNLAKSVDYEVLASGEKKTKTTSSSATKIDTRQFKTGFEAKVKSLTTGVDKLSIEETQDLAVYEQALQKISNLLGQVSADTSKATEEQKQYIAALKEASNAMVQKVSTDYTKFSDNSGNKIGAYQKLLDDYREKMSSLRTLVTSEGFSFSNEKDIRNFSEILLQIKNINTELSNSKKYTAAGSTEIERLSKQLQNWKVKNSKAMANSDFSKQFTAIENGLKPGITISDLEKLRSEFYKLDASVSKAGKTGKSFFESWKDRAKGLVSYLTTFASFYDVINILREGVQVVRELDGAFVEMQKVSNDSLSSLKEYAKESFALGDSVGTTGKQMQESAADWMRIGESLAQAKESAETSNILLNVSEFDNIDSATESLVSASQAYKDLDKIEIVDKLNNIGNNFSISTDGLATALQKSASALTTAGNDMDEALALITAGMKITWVYRNMYHRIYLIAGNASIG